MKIYLDIETLPADWSDAEIDKAARAAVPGNYTKAESIDKWIAENREDVYRRTSLDGFHARLLCIGYAIGEDAPAEVIYDEHGCSGWALGEFLKVLDQMWRAHQTIEFCGHNIAAFDLPMLRRMAWRAGEQRLARLLPNRPRAMTVIDSVDLWRGTDVHGKIPKLSQLAEFFGAGEKAGGIDGSQVYDYWSRGEHEALKAYCRQDVEMTRAIIEAML
jgi:hypothetical protein